ncbi:MAG: hypothetical protein EPN72_12180 [Nevskiaceae bacterium]|nr:MAG: hypothetical protein EPN63_00795 [Nevskiaceae bacterium]TBR72096.1 MAG: hypothetical protein EPN72_12180 [Nevskiaceae bacterium]
MKQILVALLLAAGGPALAAGAGVQPLGAQQVAQLVAPPAHGERIIMFWALSCAYCEPNMEALAKLQRTHAQDIEFVTVATDDIRHYGADIDQRLQDAGMAGYPAWAYTEATPQRLNFLIDPEWGGETPRTLVVLADGRRSAVSGRLTAAELGQLWPLPDARH